MLVAVAALAAAGCATERLARGAVWRLAEDAVAAQRDEPDLEMARIAGYANLELLEALRRSQPRRAELRLALAEGFAGIASLFAEDETLAAGCAGDGAGAIARERLAALYARGRGHAVAVLEHRHPGIESTLALPPARLSAALRDATDSRDSRALLWLAVAWLGEVGASEKPRLADLGRVRAVVGRLAALDPELMYGAPLVLLGTIDASVPAAASASADRGAAAFERAIEGPGRRLLLARVERARTLQVALNDREAFRRDLDAVLKAPADVLPGERLMTSVALRRARGLLARERALFDAYQGSIDAFHKIPCAG
jgi:hypothetical protein